MTRHGRAWALSFQRTLESRGGDVILDLTRNPGAGNDGDLDPSFRWGDMERAR